MAVPGGARADVGRLSSGGAATGAEPPRVSGSHAGESPGAGHHAPGAAAGPALPGGVTGGPVPGSAEAPPGPPALAALPGPSHGSHVPPEYQGYVRALRRRIQERLIYPQLAIRRRVEGAVELELELDAAGRLVSVGPVDRAGAAVLREAAVRAVRDATPFPFPADVAPRALLIRLPVVFELR
jgi:TonB family protein